MRPNPTARYAFTGSPYEFPGQVMGNFHSHSHNLDLTIAFNDAAGKTTCNGQFSGQLGGWIFAEFLILPKTNDTHKILRFKPEFISHDFTYN